MIFDDLKTGDWFKTTSSNKRIYQKLEPRGLEQRRASDIYGRVYLFCTFTKVELVDPPTPKELTLGYFAGRFSRIRRNR